MSTALFIVERDQNGLFTLPDGTKVKTFDVPVGAMWKCDCHGERGWLIRLPDNPGSEHGHPNLWCTLLGDEQDRRWEVTGEAPNITVNPSIFCDPPTGWHGWIRDGQLVPA